MKKRIVILILALVMLFGMLPATALAAPDPGSVRLYVAENDAIGMNGRSNITLKSSAGTVYLPGTADASKCFLCWDDADVTVNGQASGKVAVPAPGKSGSFTVASGGKSATITLKTLQGSEGISGLFFTIDESLGTISAMNSDRLKEATCYGSANLDGIDMPMSIKGRGNSTWTDFDKKPYNFTTYTDDTYVNKEKHTLIGDVNTNKWSILANAKDSTLIRNRLALELADKLNIGMPTRYVDVWINGEYNGNYLMTPKNDYQSPKAGYMIEIDNLNDPVDPQFNVRGFTGSRAPIFTIKDNNAGVTTADIQAYVQKAVTAILDTKSTDYLNYIDVESWAKMILLNEFYKTTDVVSGSIFFTRAGLADSDKLVAGPVWDFDVALGRAWAKSVTTVEDEAQVSGGKWYIDNIQTDSWYRVLAARREITQRMYELYNEYKEYFDEVPDFVREQDEFVKASADMNFDKWDVNRDQNHNPFTCTKEVTYGTAPYSVTYIAASTRDHYVTNLLTYVTARTKFLSDRLTVAAPTGTLSGASTVKPGEKMTLKASASGLSLTYQWQMGDGESWENISGATSATYSVTASGELNGKQFRCLVRENGALIDDVKNVAKVNAGTVTILGPVKMNLDAGEHDHVYKSEVTAPTCTESGYTTYTCTVCGESFRGDPVPARGHVFQNGKCSVCGIKPYTATFNCDSHCTVTVYKTQKLQNGEQNAKTAYARSGDTGIEDVSGDGQVNFMVVPARGYEVDTVTVSPANYKNLKGSADTGAANAYRITKITGDLTVTVKTKASPTPVEPEDPVDPDDPGQTVTSTIDFTKLSDASKYSILNQKNAKAEEGTGLKLVTTRAAFEPANNQLSGTQATTPEDVVSVPVSGDWVATIHSDFDSGSASNGYYQYFGFYAAEGSDYQNLAGIRGGESSLRGLLRQNGSVQTSDSSSPGVSNARSFTLRIEKKGTTYTVSRSADAETFTVFHTYENTGIEADRILIDAYTGQTEGYEFTLKYLNIEGEGEPEEPEVTPYTVTFACDAHSSVTAYDTQALSDPHEKAATAYARSSATGEIDVSGEGQVNFTVHVDEGYELVSVIAAPSANYKNLKLPAETGVENGYRATKITGDFTVTVTTKSIGGGEPEPEPFTATFVCDEHCSVTAYDTQALEGAHEKAAAAYARDSVTGAVDATGNGQVNFLVNVSEGYEIESVTAEPAASYKNLKLPDETLIPNCYRITKVVGDFTVTVKTRKKVCQHDYVSVVTAPTCTEPGFTTYTCTKCGESYLDNKTAALGHDFADGKCTRCGLTGYKLTFNCDEHCHVISYETHEYTGPVENAKYAFARNADTGEIDVSGEGQVNFKIIPDEGYAVDMVSSKSANFKNLKHPADTEVENGYRVTKIVGDVAIDITTYKLECEHDYKAEVTEPTCTEAGYTTYTCAKCGASYKTDETEALGHDYKVVTNMATCTEAGWNSYTCTRCGDSYKEEIPARGHSWDEGVVTREPTETEDGVRTYTCKTCKQTRTEGIPALDHVHSYTKTVTEPTCEAAGYTTYTCRCGDSYQADEVAALGHDYKAVVTAPTCTAEGFTTHTCSRCGDKYTDSKVAALGHDWDDGKVTAEPTEAEKGIRVFTCTRCGETKQESIPEKGHEHRYTPIVTEPTCTEPGYTTYTCECGDSYKADEVPAKGHNFVDGKCLDCGAADPDAPVVKPCPSEKYADAPAKGNWAHEGIDYCIAEGYMNGMSDTVFKPEGTVTRAQLVTILYRVAGTPATEFRGTFEDVKEGKFYSKAVEWAAREGVVTGKSATKFAPDEAITREQIAAILYRYSGSPALDADLDTFPDAASASNYARKALTWAVKEGLINGIKSEGVTYLSPKSNATRAQIAAIILRFSDGEYTCG